MIVPLLLSVLPAPTLAFSAPTTRPTAETRLAIHAKRIVLGDGQVLEDGWLTLESGVIRQVGRGVQVPSGWPVIEHDGVLTAGMVSFTSSYGNAGESHDSTASLQPELRLADGFDARESDLRWALRQGITTLVLVADSDNLAGGVAAVVKTDGEVLQREGPLTLSLSDSVADLRREPTSYGGALRILGDALADPKGVWQAVGAGRQPVLIHADERHEIDRAARFAKEHGLTGALVGAPRAGELAQALSSAALGVVLEPIRSGDDRHELETPASLAEANVPFAFALHSVDPLRLSTALAMKGGLAGDVAWRALSADAARLAGVGERVGRLASGMDADLVLWSGDPTELASSVRAVYVGGRLAWREAR
jgi:imidazolonepropionase-like amidohydrolase